MIWFELIGGLVLLLGGGDALVKGSVGIAARMGVSQLMIGLTLVGFGTSMPEFVTSVEAALNGSPGIAVGNVVGSNVANVLLILGLSAAIMPIATGKEAFCRDGTVLIVASLLTIAVMLSGTIGPWIGAVFLVLLASYVGYTYVTERSSPDASAEMHAAQAEANDPGRMPVWLGLVLLIGGIVGVVLGADLLVRSATEVAQSFGISETIIGLTLVAVGTSMPELATSVMAAIRRNGDVAFGNVIGSNIFNVLGVLGATALVAPMAVPSEVIRLDVWVMLGTSVLLVVFAISGWHVSRREGWILLGAYGLYLVAQFSPSVRDWLSLT